MLTHVALDQTEYQKRYNSLTQRTAIEAFLESFKALPDTLTEFQLENWHSLVDYVTVYSVNDIRFTFKNGQEVQA